MDKVVVQLTVNDPAMDTPEVRAYLDACAAIITNDAQFQARCAQAREDILMWGSTVLTKEDVHGD